MSRIAVYIKVNHSDFEVYCVTCYTRMLCKVEWHDVYILLDNCRVQELFDSERSDLNKQNCATITPRGIVVGEFKD